MPRLDFPGQFYHVIVRGVERRPIFNVGDDKTDFLGRLAKSLQKTSSQCFAWALMTNHLHLLILSGAKGLAALMHPLLTGYVGAFNRRTNRVGHLVQNRFKAILCDADAYFQQLVRYIHLNPVRAGIVKTLEELADYPWTGHPAVLGRIRPAWQAVDPLLSHFGLTVDQARRTYGEFLQDGWTEGHRDDLEGGGRRGLLSAMRRGDTSDESMACDQRILGEGDFVQEMWKMAEEADKRSRIFGISTMSLSELQRQAATATGADSEALLRADRRRPVTEARALLIYAATDLCGRSGAEVSQYLNISSSAVSAARPRGRALAERYRFLERLSLLSPRD